MSIKRENAERIYPQNPTLATPGAAKKWWESTNFFASAILFFAGMWGLNSADFDLSVKSLVMQIYTLVGTAGIFRTYLVNAKLNIKAWLSNGNTYQYLVAALTGTIPNLPADADDKLFDLVEAIKTGNIGIIISAAVTFAVFAWNWWKSQPGKAPASTK